MRGRAGGSGADQAQVAMEMGTFDLDGEVDSLRQKVGRMKRLAGDIGDESRLQGQLLANLDETLQKARQGVKRGLRKMDKAFKQVNSNHILYLMAFVVLLFLGMYVWAKTYPAVRFGGGIFGSF